MSSTWVETPIYEQVVADLGYRPPEFSAPARHVLRERPTPTRRGLPVHDERRRTREG